MMKHSILFVTAVFVCFIFVDTVTKSEHIMYGSMHGLLVTYGIWKYNVTSSETFHMLLLEHLLHGRTLIHM